MKSLLFFTLIVLMQVPSCKKSISVNKKTRDLNSGWMFSLAGDSLWLKATVPGTIHTDLLANERIPDPFIGYNEDSVQWIESKDWIYECTFSISEEEMEFTHHELIFEGLDTYADVYLNDEKIIEADNMFLLWKEECSALIKKGENHLKIYFHSAVKKGLEKASKLDYILIATNEQAPDSLKTNVFSRKAPFHFGWDWGPRLVTCGIWRPVTLRSWNHAIIKDFHIVQENFEIERCDYSVRLELNVETEGRYKVQVSEHELGLLAEVSKKLKKGINQVAVPIHFENPKLWWTNGLGKSHLYSLDITLLMQGKELDSINHSLGIRKLELVQNEDEKGRSFQFELNGQRVFMKGANYIPGDIFTPRVTPEKYERVIREATMANMNMLRVWGGAIYEDDIFYELCDKNGILVWQDFMFACALQPGDSGHLNNIKREAEYNVKRLRNHPSLALWCGNNENLVAWHNWGWQNRYTGKQNEFLWQTYKNIFYKILPEVVNTYDPERTYWPSSPQSYGDILPDRKSGDEHDWTVWFGEREFSAYGENVPRFVSEYGLQSFPDLETLMSFAEKKDLKILSPLLDHRQRSKMNWIEPGFNGNDMILRYIEKYFPSPKKIEDLVYMSQLSHQLSMKEAIEAHRKSMPWCMGSLYWQINDCWPTISWASVDYNGNWKASHYQAKRSFRSLILTEELKGNVLSLTVVSDFTLDKPLTLELYWMSNKGNFTGNSVSKDIVAKANTSTLIYQEEIIGDPMNYRAMTFIARLFDKEMLVDEKLISLVRPKEEILQKPKITYAISRRSDAYIIDLETDVPVKFISLSMPGIKGWFDDNFFHMSPDNPRRIYFFTQQLIQDPESLLTIKTLNDYQR